MDQADLIYRYDWACMVECHKGFSWLLDFGGTDDWDSPKINT